MGAAGSCVGPCCRHGTVFRTARTCTSPGPPGLIVTVGTPLDSRDRGRSEQQRQAAAAMDAEQDLAASKMAAAQRGRQARKDAQEQKEAASSGGGAERKNARKQKKEEDKASVAISRGIAGSVSARRPTRSGLRGRSVTTRQRSRAHNRFDDLWVSFGKVFNLTSLVASNPGHLVTPIIEAAGTIPHTGSTRSPSRCAPSSTQRPSSRFPTRRWGSSSIARRRADGRLEFRHRHAVVEGQEALDWPAHRQDAEDHPLQHAHQAVDHPRGACAAQPRPTPAPARANRVRLHPRAPAPARVLTKRAVTRVPPVPTRRYIYICARARIPIACRLRPRPHHACRLRPRGFHPAPRRGEHTSRRALVRQR